MGSYLAHVPEIYPKAHKNPRAFSCISGPIYLEFSIQCPCGVGLHQIDPKKVKAILEMPEPRTEKQVRGFLGRLNYIARFISQLTPTREPIFKLLRKNQAVLWNSDCQEAFEKIKQSLVNPPVLMPPVTGRSLMTVLDESMGACWVSMMTLGRRNKPFTI